MLIKYGKKLAKIITLVLSPLQYKKAVKAVTAKFTAEELIIKREDVKEQIKINLAERLVKK